MKKIVLALVTAGLFTGVMAAGTVTNQQAKAEIAKAQKYAADKAALAKAQAEARAKATRR